MDVSSLCVASFHASVPSTVFPSPSTNSASENSSADKNQYKVTCADGKTFTVAFLKPKKGTKGTVKIPGSVTVNHVTYKVTAIAANAFKNQKKIKKVVTPRAFKIFL